MTTFKMPPEPDGPLWVTIDGKHQRVTRSAAGNDWGPIECRSVTWPELLALGEVSDVHPDLPADAPLPWGWTGSQIEDANGQAVRFWANHAPLIVKAVNAYGERDDAEAEWASKADRALTQERARADDAEAEVIRRWDELTNVLQEVRALLDHGPFSPEYIAARSALRARLDLGSE